MKKPAVFFRQLNYAQKIMLTASLVLLVTALLLSAFFWQLSARTFEQQERELLERGADNTYTQMDIALSSVQNLTTQLVRSGDLAALYRLQDLSPEQVAAHTDKLWQAMDTILSTAPVNSVASIYFIGVYLENGYICTAPAVAQPYADYDVCVRELLAAGVADLDDYVPTRWVGNAVLPNGYNCLMGMRFLYEPVTLNKVGVVVVGIRQLGLQRLFSALMPGSVLIREDGTVIAASRLEAVGSRVEDGAALTAQSPGRLVTRPDGSRAFVYRLTSGAAWLVCPLDESQLSQNAVVTHYTRRVFLITLAAVLLALLLMWFSTKRLTRSLVRLKATVQRIYDGDLKARFQTDQQDEIAYLGLRINDMMEQVEASFLLQERDAAEKRDLELRLMRAQINPHLLYNTLNSVLWIIRQKDMDKAEHLILSMGSFFRLALSKGNDEIPLSAEIAMIQHYLEIQNLGRGKSFRLRNEIGGEWGNNLILRLTLQTLVENSVIHGFSDWRDDGEIALSARRGEGDTLCISVTDNGIGILPEDLKALTAQMNAAPSGQERTHYGLYNVNRRIKNKYGDRCGLSIQSEVGEYTRICVTIPVREGDMQ